MKERILNYQFSFLNYSFTPRSLVAHPLFSGSAIMIIGSNFTNFVAYLYHIVVGRMLGPSSYGELVAVLALMGLFFTSFSFISLVVVKFVSAAKKTQLKGIYSWFTSRVNKLSVVVAVLLVLVAPRLSSYLHIDLPVLMFLVPILVVGMISVVQRAFLQALLQFKKVVVSTVVDIIGRLVLGIIFIYMGFSVLGAVFGIFIASFVALILLRYFLSEYGGGKEGDVVIESRKVFMYSIGILVASVATNSLFSTDVILVKHYFAPFDAGIYASLSTLGKIIFYGTAPVGAVMFPMVSKKYSKGESSKKILILSLIFVSVIAFGVTGVFWLFPELSIKILFGTKFLDAAVYLTRFGIFMSIFAISSLLINFHLSCERSRVVIVALISATFQIIGIILFHNSILAIINVSIIAVSFLLFSLLLFLYHEIKKGEII